MFLKKVCIFLAISFLAVDILLLSLYFQATNNLTMLSDNMLDNNVRYYSNAGIKINKEDIVKKVPDNKIYTFSSDNTEAGILTAEKLSERLFSKNASVNIVETPEGLSYSISDSGVNSASLRVYNSSFGFEYVFGEHFELAQILPDGLFYNHTSALTDEDERAVDDFMNALCTWSKPCYEITGCYYSGNKMFASMRQLVDKKCPVEGMYVNAIIENGDVLYAKGNIILAAAVKSFSEPLYDGVNALNKVDSSIVSEFVSERIVYMHRYAGNNVYYLIPLWKIEYLDMNGKLGVQYVDAIKN